MKLKIGSLLLFALPFFASAQALSAQGFITNFLIFANTVLVPFLLGIAFLFFVFNVIRFFVAGGGNEDDRTKAKSLAIYGVLAFVIMVVFWGIVNLLSSSLGFAGKNVPTPDYLQKNGTSFPASNSNPQNSNTNAVPTTNNGPTNLLPPSLGGPAANGNPTPANPPAPSALPPSGGGPAVENINCPNGIDSDGNVCGIY